MPSTHRCAGPGCTEQIPHSKLACLRHWNQVSAPVQREVYAAYREAQGSTRHYEAMQAAIKEMSE